MEEQQGHTASGLSREPPPKHRSWRNARHIGGTHRVQGGEWTHPADKAPSQTETAPGYYRLYRVESDVIGVSLLH